MLSDRNKKKTAKETSSHEKKEENIHTHKHTIEQNVQMDRVEIKRRIFFQNSLNGIVEILPIQKLGFFFVFGFVYLSCLV